MKNQLLLIWVCFRVMARIECLACISNTGFERRTCGRARDKGGAAHTYLLRELHTQFHALPVHV